MFNHPLPARRRIHRFKAGGKWFDVASPAQSQHKISAQQRFERAPDFGPKLNLPGDGPFHSLACDPGVQQQRVRNLDWLTHVQKVAKRYQLSSQVPAARLHRRAGTVRRQRCAELLRGVAVH
jgi:hypothetical protein